MPTTIQGVTLYNVVEAAQELNVSKNTMHKWIKTGKIKAHKIGKPYYITETSIQDMMGPLFKQEKE
jgi:putative resolvase